MAAFLADSFPGAGLTNCCDIITVITTDSISEKLGMCVYKKRITHRTSLELAACQMMPHKKSFWFVYSWKHNEHMPFHVKKQAIDADIIFRFAIHSSLSISQTTHPVHFYCSWKSTRNPSIIYRYILTKSRSTFPSNSARYRSVCLFMPMTCDTYPCNKIIFKS